MSVPVAPAPKARTLPALTPVIGLLVLTAFAVALRFWNLGGQSFWYDEAITVDLTQRSFSGMLSGVQAHEATPPLYFALAWLWTRVFGDGEAGLRSLSAVAGVLTVPASYAAARALVSERAGLICAALVAVSPPLIWYSQEARAYELLVLMCALSLWLFARALRTPSARSLAGWAVLAFLAVLTHYFALFLVVPEAIFLLLWGRERRRTAVAVGGLALAGLALSPLALYQQEHGGAGWIGDKPFGPRVEDAADFFVRGNVHGGHTVTGIAFLVVIGAIAFAVWRGEASDRRAALIALGLGGAALAIPLAGAVAGFDYVLDRNLLPAWIPLALAAAVGLGIQRARLAGIAIAVVACVLLLRYDVTSVSGDELARDDWRAAASVVGPPRAARVVVVSPGWQARTLRIYQPGLVRLRSPAEVNELDVVMFAGELPRSGPRGGVYPPPSFRLVETKAVHHLTVARYAAAAPVRVAPDIAGGGGENGASAFLQGGGD